MFVEIFLEEKDINFVTLKLTVSHTERQSLGFCGVCMPWRLT